MTDDDRYIRDVFFPQLGLPTADQRWANQQYQAFKAQLAEQIGPGPWPSSLDDAPRSEQARANLLRALKASWPASREMTVQSVIWSNLI